MHSKLTQNATGILETKINRLYFMHHISLINAAGYSVHMPLSIGQNKMDEIWMFKFERQELSRVDVTMKCLNKSWILIRDINSKSNINSIEYIFAAKTLTSINIKLVKYLRWMWNQQRYNSLTWIFRFDLIFSGIFDLISFRCSIATHTLRSTQLNSIDSNNDFVLLLLFHSERVNSKRVEPKRSM